MGESFQAGFNTGPGFCDIEYEAQRLSRRMKAHVSKSRCCLCQAGYGRSEVHRLPEIENAKERVGLFQHMVRGRTTAPAGLILGHEITGEIIEKGTDVEMLEVGDLVSVPFNIACGRCRNCREGRTGICLTVNPARPGAAYGYVDMGGWVGGLAERLV